MSSRRDAAGFHSVRREQEEEWGKGMEACGYFVRLELSRDLLREYNTNILWEKQNVSPAKPSQVSRNEALIEKWDNSVYKKYVNFLQILTTWGLTENTKILYAMFVIQVHN